MKPSRWWLSGKSLGLRGLLSLWSQVRAMWLPYDDHWRLTWSLTSEPVGLVEARASSPDTHVKKKKKRVNDECICILVRNSDTLKGLNRHICILVIWA